MTAPTQRAMRAFWEAQPEGDYTCSDCGTVGPKTYIQPQHPYYAHGLEGTALCSDCISRQQSRDHGHPQSRASPPPPGGGGSATVVCGSSMRGLGRAPAVGVDALVPFSCLPLLRERAALA